MSIFVAVFIAFISVQSSWADTSHSSFGWTGYMSVMPQPILHKKQKAGNGKPRKQTLSFMPH